MQQTSSIKQRIYAILSDDPLFQSILDTPAEQLCLSEPYLDDVIEKKYYSTPKIARWCSASYHSSLK